MIHRRRISLFAALTLAACRTGGTASPAAEVKDATPPADSDHPFTGSPAMNFALYQNEHYKTFADGSTGKTAEIAEFWNIAAEIRARQARAAPANGGTKRGFHAKQHGCLTGRMVLSSRRPNSAKIGIFSDAKQCYNVLVRFSNGVGTINHDRKPDVRGMALKIFGTDMGGTEPFKNLDILMTNAPNPFGVDTKAFANFGAASFNPVSGAFLTFLRNNGGLNPNYPDLPPNQQYKDALTGKTLSEKILRKISRPVDSVATEQYWSGHPYLMGPSQAMKFNLCPSGSPCDSAGTPASPPPAPNMSKVQMLSLAASTIGHMLAADVDAFFDGFSPNLLAKDLATRIASGPLTFTLQGQFDANSDRTPVEDVLTEWREADSASVPLAQVTLDKQIADDACDGLAFTPGRFNTQHRPLSNMGRGRIFVYEASAQARQANPGAGNPAVSLDDPDEAGLFGSVGCGAAGAAGATATGGSGGT